MVVIRKITPVNICLLTQGSPRIDQEKVQATLKGR